jgi:hypothetical protein
MLGYLNFSEGNADVRFQRNVNEFFRHASNAEPWQELDQALRDSISELRGTSTAFRNTHQAEAVIELVFAKLLPAYRAHHADLLFHLSDAELVQPLFLARAFEAVLAEAGPWNETDRILRGSLQRLNDFVGYRPVAVLERKRCEPFDHERVRPIPLFIRGAGVAVGKYEGIITRAFEILGKTDPELLREAQFDLDMLDELALDPRAYDFAHPVNQRPNYQFGEWDPHCIDNAGNYRRFVVRQVTLDALLERAQVPSQGSAKTEAEAAAAPPDSGQNSTESSFLNPEPRTLNPEP